MKRVTQNVSYGLNQPLNLDAALPIVSNRAPTANDTAEVGTIWCNKTSGSFYVLTSVSAGQAQWTLGGDGSVFDQIDGDSGSANPIGGVINLIGNNQGATFVGSSNTIQLALNDLSADSFVATTGDITADAGDIVATLGDITSVAGNVEGVGIVATGDNTGISATTSLTNVSVASTSGAGNLTIKSNSAGSATNAGFIKMYSGTTAIYIPYFTNVAP